MKQKEDFFRLTSLVGYLFCLKFFELIISTQRYLQYKYGLPVWGQVMITFVIIVGLFYVFVWVNKSWGKLLHMILGLIGVILMPLIGSLVHKLTGDLMIGQVTETIIKIESNISIISFSGAILLTVSIILFLMLKAFFIGAKRTDSDILDR